MAQVEREPVHSCRGCPRVFDSVDDICQVAACGYCRKCHHTVYGQPQPHSFNDSDLVED
jgi:hypothetical protein